MDGLEAAQRMLPDQVAGESEDLIPEIHANIAFPIVLELTDAQRVVST